MLSVICNAPAKAFIKKILTVFSVLWLRNRCAAWRMGRKMTFRKVNADLRTDAAFDEMRDVDHHKGPSPFHNTGIKLQMVSQFPLDYMHLVCLRVYSQMPRVVLDERSLRKSFQ